MSQVLAITHYSSLSTHNHLHSNCVNKTYPE